MKDLRLILTLKNNILVSFREQRGWNQAEFCKKVGIEPSQYGAYENLKKYPLNAKGIWNKMAKKLESFTKIPCEVLFPEAFEHIQTIRIEKEVSAAEAILAYKVPQLLISQDPSAGLEKEDFSKAVELGWSKLGSREKNILDRIYGFHGHIEESMLTISIETGLSRSRIHQIEQQALRKLRSPGVAKYLAKFI